MSNQKYTDEQKQLIISLARLKKTPKEISDITGINKEAVKGQLGMAKRAKKLEYNKKYCKEYRKEAPQESPPETLREKEAKVYNGKFDDEIIPEIKFKRYQFKSVFDERL